MRRRQTRRAHGKSGAVTEETVFLAASRRAGLSWDGPRVSWDRMGGLGGRPGSGLPAGRIPVRPSATSRTRRAPKLSLAMKGLGLVPSTHKP